MEPPCPSFADEFNVPQEYAVLVFDVRRAPISLPFQVHRLKVLVESGLVAFSCACFEIAGEVPEEAQHSLAHLPNIFSSHLYGLSKVVLWGSARRRLLASPLCCHAAFISASTPGLVHQLCAPRGGLERGTNSAAIEIMRSTMSVAMSLMQVPSGIDESAATIVFATWHQRYGSVINRLRSASFGYLQSNTLLDTPMHVFQDYHRSRCLIKVWVFWGFHSVQVKTTSSSLPSTSSFHA